jgi:hypothetical protein
VYKAIAGPMMCSRHRSGEVSSDTSRNRNRSKFTMASSSGAQCEPRQVEPV